MVYFPWNELAWTRTVETGIMRTVWLCAEIIPFERFSDLLRGYLFNLTSEHLPNPSNLPDYDTVECIKEQGRTMTTGDVTLTEPRADKLE